VRDDETDAGAAKDVGLARERTDLAWNRSGLAVAVTVAIVLRRLWPLSGDRGDAALALIAAGAVIWVLGMRLGRRLTHPRQGAATLGESGCFMLTLGAVVLAIAGFVAGIL
jgi:uncharacterized membrane protein YidH (DUF202 family)